LSQHIYFLGIGGTLMGSLAQLAQQMGYRVSGSDQALYPPMSDQLDAAGIRVYEGFDPAQLEPVPDLIVIGNAGLPRGHEAVEYILEKGLPYTSGAQWLGETVLRDRWVLAAAGTHGKTTTASMLAWILDQAGLQPGYLIGGAPKNFAQSARLGNSPFFVVEADEYDTSYFDRRSKFVHYRPRTLILNNLEFDHADIFDDITDIQVQFHNLLRTVPAGGLILAPSNDERLNEVLNMGCWTPVARVGEGPVKKPIDADNGERWHTGEHRGGDSSFDVMLGDETLGHLDWGLLGRHNQLNGLNAIAAARHAGVPVAQSIDALSRFEGVKRRMEVLYDSEKFALYFFNDTATTEIYTTLEGLRKRVSSDDIFAVIEPRTHTMSLGALRHELTTCCAAADRVLWFRGENIKWDLSEVVQHCVIPAQMVDKHEAVIAEVLKAAQTGTDNSSMTGNQTHNAKKCHVVIMSNGAFGGIYKDLVERLGG
jgi:UDP-N-acetylmuramate: L-alanyl-gamma-D-glutamyl-meso-diaminopimelate ligase